MIEILTNFDDTPLEKIETLEFDIKNYNQYINMWNEYKNKGLDVYKRQRLYTGISFGNSSINNQE